MQMLSWNLAEEQAKRFHLPNKAASEAGWQFRERIARALEKMEERLIAQEVLYNRRMSEDLFAHGELSSGYGDEFITRIALQTELAFQDMRKQQEHRQKWQILLTRVHFWQKPRINE